MEFKKTHIALAIILTALVIIAIVLTVVDIDEIKQSEPKNNASIVVVGDVMFARNMAGVLSSGVSPFSKVANVTGTSDLLLINFENAATSSTNAVKGDVPLKCDPSFVPLAKANNNTVAALANNHMFDYGVTGMQDTLKYLDEAGIPHTGAGNNESQAREPVVVDLNGRNVTILNYMDSNNFKEYSSEVMPQANGSNAGYSAYNSDVAKQQIQDAKGNGSDLVLVYFHFGNEYSRTPNEDQIKMAHEVIDDGADVVLGTHPHVTQGIEMYNGKPIFYSLGNFIFDLQNSATQRDYFVEIDLVNDTGECTVYPVDIVGYEPQFMSPEYGSALLQELSPQCDQLEITENGTGKLTFNLTSDEYEK